jgi:hypothetical protein
VDLQDYDIEDWYNVTLKLLQKKGGLSSLLKNYRPISLLDILS